MTTMKRMDIMTTMTYT